MKLTSFHFRDSKIEFHICITKQFGFFVSFVTTIFATMISEKELEFFKALIIQNLSTITTKSYTKQELIEWCKKDCELAQVFTLEQDLGSFPTINSSDLLIKKL